jgi:hypothetical protein
MREGKDFDETNEDDSERLYTLEELMPKGEVKEGETEERSISKDERDNLLREIHDELLTEDERDELVRDIAKQSKKLHETENTSRKRTFQDLDPNEVYRLYYEERFSQRKVAEVLGSSRDAIQKLFRIQGWEFRSVGGVEKDIDPQEVYRICIEEGSPKKEAAEALGCKSTKPINRVLKENDWQTPLEKKMEIDIDPDEVHRLHFEDGWSFIRIANHYGYESKDIISKLFKERDWTPIPISRRVVYEFPSEIADEHQIESSRVSDVFEHLRVLEDVSPLDVAHCIENVVPPYSSKSRVQWVELSTHSNWYTKVAKVLGNELTEVETSLNELLGYSESSKMKVRLGFVDDKLYIRYQDKSEYNWLNIYENELFYFKSVSDKFKLIHEMRARLGLTTNTDLGRLIDQLTDRESAEGNGYSDIKECQDEHLRAETLHLILDTTGNTLQDLQEMIHCIGKIRSGEYEGKGGIRNPQFPSDPETIDIMFARFFGLGFSDGHLGATHLNFIYAERNRDRRAIVKQHSKNFGDVYSNEKEVDGEVCQIQFASVFGRALKKRGFPVGDKCFLNIGLPDFIKNGSLQTVCVYFSNMWPEDGCFVFTGSNNRGEFKWGRSVVIRNPSKELEYERSMEVTDVHLAFLKEYGTHIKEDIDNDFKEKIELTAPMLDELTKSENSRISSIANEIKDIVYDNQPKLLLDEIEVLHKIGIHAIPRFIEIDYFVETSRVSVAWSGRIQRKTDVMRTSLQMLPDDIRKSAKVKEWMKLNPALAKQIEREINQNRDCDDTCK